ncbi:hypothetical protein IKF21_00705 [Candidatus Saccharibacteria bacterium]|nr:hypothetical protein [Candidatus Saccharibacteria bacterium]
MYQLLTHLGDQTTVTIDNATAAAFAGGIVGSMLVFVSLFAVFCYILLVIAGWKIFEKAGEAGWKSLIPIYNAYIFYKIVGMKNWFWGLLITSFVISFIVSLMGQPTQVNQIDYSQGTGIIACILLCGLGIFAIVASVIYSIRTSKIFGHGIGFAIGLFFLQNIFLLILGFGKSKYNKKLAKTWM